MAEKTSGWPITGGSGPAAGIIGITDKTSVRVLCRYYPPGNGVEFVYVPSTRQLVTGRPRICRFNGSPHQQLAHSINAVHSYVLGGMLQRGPQGEFLTNEQSGHYGQNWTNFYRHFFPRWLSEMTGLAVLHQSWETK